MSPLFGRKREEGRTVLILDVENGSVGASLVRFSPNHLPKMFGEIRKAVPLQITHDTDALARLTQDAVISTLAHVAQVAARARAHTALAPVGQVDSVVIFLSPPWGALTLAERELPPHPFIQRIEKSLEAFFGRLPVALEPFGLMAAHTTPIILPSEEHCLVTAISGEVTELILLENAGSHLKIIGHATLPLGRHFPIRTLTSHGGFSEAEAKSAMSLYAIRISEQGGDPHHAFEALHSAGAHVASEFGSVAKELLQHVPARRIIVVAQEPAGEWFAHSLAKSPELEHLFPEAGEVRAVRASHALPFVGMHSSRPDLPLLLEVLFVNTRLPKDQTRFMSSV
jgi:hypothetical protein